MRISDWSSDVCSSDLGAELAGALQGDGLGVEGAHVQHLLEQRHERLGVLHRWRQFARQFAVGAEVLEVFDFEFRGDGHRNPGPGWYRGGPGPRVPAGCAVEVRTGGPGPECRSWRASRGRSEEHTSELQSLLSISY